MSQSRGASFSYLVVPAGPADAEDLAQVHVRAWRETYRGLLPDAVLARMSEVAYARRFRRGLMYPGPHDVTLLATSRAGVFGYVQAGPSRSGLDGEAEISTLYVLREAQGRGVGRRLLIDAARALAVQGAHGLVVSSLRDNIPARRFYQHLGGAADAPRQERGPGGGLYWEVAYRWPDITALL